MVVNDGNSDGLRWLAHVWPFFTLQPEGAFSGYRSAGLSTTLSMSIRSVVPVKVSTYRPTFLIACHAAGSTPFRGTPVVEIVIGI